MISKKLAKFYLILIGILKRSIFDYFCVLDFSSV